jgi:hypothetical protein
MRARRRSAGAFERRRRELLRVIWKQPSPSTHTTVASGVRGLRADRGRDAVAHRAEARRT